MDFKLNAPYQPTGDQPEAIRQLVDGINKGYMHQVLLGATGTGKTAVMAARVADNPLSGEWRIQVGGFVLVWPDPIARLPQRYVRWALVGLLTAATYLWLTNKPLSPHSYVDALLLGVLPRLFW